MPRLLLHRQGGEREDGGGIVWRDWSALLCSKSRLCAKDGERMGSNVEREIRTTIEKIEPGPGQRLLVVSDIHGHLNRFVQLLRKMEYGGDDILILVGDLVDKGPESLRVVQYVMDLCRQHPVYVTMGNVDHHRLAQLWADSPESDEEFAGFLKWSKEFWGCSFGQEMLSDLGLRISQIDAGNAGEYKRRIREEFHAELAFLWSRPVILTAGDYLFVHGGVVTDDLEALAGADPVSCLKFDDFWNRGISFTRYTVVTGHWPVCLYRQDREDLSPLIDVGRRILCVDGGCGVKATGQLNGIILPDCRAGLEEISWVSCDDFRTVRALEDQAEAPSGLHIQYFDSKVELLEKKDNLCRIRHSSSGKELVVPGEWLYQGKNGSLCCTDCCDGKLGVCAGDLLSVIYEAKGRLYGKKRGLSGWYEGRVEPVENRLLRKAGAPVGDNGRRERELAVYRLLERLGIFFERIDHGEANTMEACEEVDRALDAVICKNLFLCNQQRTRFFLLMMPEEKTFRTRELSRQINGSRLSFGEAVYMERFLKTSPGSVSVMGLMNDEEGRVQLLIDRDILGEEWFGCHPCMNTSSIRLRLSDLLERFLPAVRHAPLFVDLSSD